MYPTICENCAYVVREYASRGIDTKYFGSLANVPDNPKPMVRIDANICISEDAPITNFRTTHSAKETRKINNDGKCKYYKPFKTKDTNG